MDAQCPNCGATLHVYDLDQAIRCRSCGAEFRVGVGSDHIQLLPAKPASGIPVASEVCETTPNDLANTVGPLVRPASEQPDRPTVDSRPPPPAIPASALERLEAHLIDGLIGGALMVAFVIPGWLYYCLKDSVGKTGRSIGRKTVECRLVGNAGLPLSPGKCLARNLVKWLGYVFTLGALFLGDCVAILAREDRRSLCDLIFDSKVIREGTKPAPVGKTAAFLASSAIAFLVAVALSVLVVRGLNTSKPLSPVSVPAQQTERRQPSPDPYASALQTYLAQAEKEREDNNRRLAEALEALGKQDGPQRTPATPYQQAAPKAQDDNTRLDFETLVKLTRDGGLVVMAQDGTFLGKVSADEYASDSLSNQYGAYGSPYNAKSLFNKYGEYGSPYRTDSATNSFAPNPPFLAYKGRFVAYVTVNTRKTPRVSVATLKAAIEAAKE